MHFPRQRCWKPTALYFGKESGALVGQCICMSQTAHLFKFNPYFHAILCSKCFCSCRYIRTLYKCVHSRVYTMHGGRLSQVQHCIISWCLLSGAGGTEWGIVMTGIHGPMPIHQWPDQLSVEPPLGTLHSNFCLFRKLDTCTWLILWKLYLLMCPHHLLQCCIYVGTRWNLANLISCLFAFLAGCVCRSYSSHLIHSFEWEYTVPYSTVVLGVPLCCVVLCCRFEPLPAELPW